MHHTLPSMRSALILGFCLTAATGVSKAYNPNPGVILSVEFPNPPAGQVTVGSTITANIFLSGLGGSLDLGAFDISLSYNSSLLSLSSVSLGTGLNLGNPAQSSYSVSTPPGAVNTQEISFVAPSILATSQPDDLVLFTVTFLGLANGISPFPFTKVDLSDGAGGAFSPANISDGQIAVVPEPATIGLASGLAALAFASWRRGARR